MMSNGTLMLIWADTTFCLYRTLTQKRGTQMLHYLPTEHNSDEVCHEFTKILNYIYFNFMFEGGVVLDLLITKKLIQNKVDTKGILCVKFRCHTY